MQKTEFSLLNAARNHPEAPDPLQDVYADYMADTVRAEETVSRAAGTASTTSGNASGADRPPRCASRGVAHERLQAVTAVTLLPFHELASEQSHSS